MADWTVISYITEELLKRLRDGLCPEIIRDRTSIGASNDLEKADFILNLYLYNIAKADGTVLNDLDGPFTALKLEYMLTANFGGDKDTVTEAEQIILGRAVEVLGDAPFIRPEGHMPVSVEMNILSLYDKNSIIPKRPALFYYASPVLIRHKKGTAAPLVKPDSFLIHTGLMDGT